MIIIIIIIMIIIIMITLIITITIIIIMIAAITFTIVEWQCMYGKRESIHRHLLEVICETATVPELRQKLLYTTPPGWSGW